MALDIYLSGEYGPRGCFTVMTAASEAVADPEIRAMVLEAFRTRQGVRRLLPPREGEGRIAGVRRSRGAGATRLATIHTIAIRARAQVPRKELEAIVKGAIDVMSRG